MMQKVVVAPFSSALFIIFGLSQLFLSPLQADEMMNISDVKDCQGISGDAGEEPESSVSPATKISVDQIQVTVVRVKKILPQS